MISLSSTSSDKENVTTKQESNKHARFDDTLESVTFLNSSTIDGVTHVESNTTGKIDGQELPEITNETEMSSSKAYQSAMRTGRFGRNDVSSSSPSSDIQGAGSGPKRGINRLFSLPHLSTKKQSNDNASGGNTSTSNRNGFKRLMKKHDTKIRMLALHGKQVTKRGNKKKRILAIHGKQANRQVTKLQLDNLQITPDRYDIVYLNGPIPEEVGDPTIANFVNGPFYSWFYSNSLDPRFKSSLLHAIVYLMKAIQDMGPFDAIYGFSQGATMATIIAIAYIDEAMKKAIVEEYNDLKGRENSSQVKVGDGVVQDRRDLFRQQQTQSKKKSFKNSMASVRNLITSVAQPSFDASIFDEKPFSYMILACAVGLPQEVMTAFGFSGEYLKPSSIDIPSFHLIGMDDPCRPMGEDMLTFFYGAQIKYMIGGHGVYRHIESDNDTLHTLHDGIKSLRNGVSMRFSDMSKISAISSLAPMSKWQVAAVKLEGLTDTPTITALLENKDPNKPMFYDARVTDSSKYLSYGGALKFIRGGPGDLRRLGIKQGEVVAYVVPGNGGAVAALAFLSICSQTTAAPLAPSTVEKDAIYLIEKYDAKHLIIFDGVECPGIESAQLQLVTAGKLTLHRAKIRDIGDVPGMFDFVISDSQELEPSWFPSNAPLKNPSNGVGLLLSTSGTTSKPKGVPILHGALVHNGEIIASSLGLNHTDVCYSIMPLFHIGGIAASIMCTLASGGAVCCDGETYNPEKMVEAITLSEPQPTWYSAVPTIHNSTVSFIKTVSESSDSLEKYGIQKSGIWNEGHSLRFIRSGAAALLGPDAELLSTTYGGIPVYPTYSMSEQMPISQPPEGKNNMILDKPGSVGVPVAATVAIVGTKNLKILPYGEEGEVAISGGTVIEHYLNNKEADSKAFFALTPSIEHNSPYAHCRYFLTGDIGILDKEGYLTLKGRNKEMIKKGGEQITPMEVEEHLLEHPWIETVVCFSVPSRIYGEEVGCAIILSSSAPEIDIADIKKELKDFLREQGLPPLKWPTRWKRLASATELPQTKTKKFIRVDSAKKLNMLEEDTGVLASPDSRKQVTNTFIDWDVISGFRFCLSCYVMFMHFGSNDSWGAIANLRGWPWHVHVFFTLGGFSMAAPMNPAISKKFKYFLTRIGTMYPMYIVALIFALINLLVTCRPSTFQSNFSWNARPDDLYVDGDEKKGVSPLFCEGTPVTPNSYWASLFLTLLVYIIGAPITLVWVLNWWMGYYFWFSAMYYQCLMIFPGVYNFLLKHRSNYRWYLGLLISMSFLNYIILGVTWLLVKDAEGYNIYNVESGEKNDIHNYKDASLDNVIILGWYLFSPFWMLYFVIGACAAFLYDAHRPAEKNNRYVWGLIADGCTFIVVIWSIFMISQGNTGRDIGGSFYLRPQEANNFTDTASVNRIWDNICGRLFAPATTLWVFALSTGRGFTASILRSQFLVENLAPHSYNCFLFHQMIGQWYFAATRNGHWWNWWRYRKSMYWFSPAPCPVEWYEYFYLVGLTVCFSTLMNVTMQPMVNALLTNLKNLVVGENDFDDVTIEESLLVAIEEMSGFAPELDWTLDQCGLSSVGLPILAARLKEAFSTKTRSLNITTAALSTARTIQDLVKVLEEIDRLSASEGI